MASVTFTIPGKPFGKQRARAGKGHSGRARVFTPEPTVSFERQVGTIAGQHIRAPLHGPVLLTVEAFFAVPASWSKAKQRAMLGQPHTQKPDTSNIVKAVEDGMNLIAYADDAQIADQVARKRWALVNETRVTLAPLGGPA